MNVLKTLANDRKRSRPYSALNSRGLVVSLQLQKYHLSRGEPDDELKVLRHLLSNLLHEKDALAQ